MDQTLVRSGFDLEIALGERYLQYLLLLALDVGLIPVEFTFVEPEHPEKGPIQALMVVPSAVDRTYSLDPAAVPRLDAAKLATLPEGYRHLAYIQTRIGYTVKMDMPMLQGPVVDELYARGARWLAGGVLER